MLWMSQEKQQKKIVRKYSFQKKPIKEITKDKRFNQCRTEKLSREEYRLPLPLSSL